jgi:hypothetical protein
MRFHDNLGRWISRISSPEINPVHLTWIELYISSKKICDESGNDYKLQLLNVSKYY